ECSLCYKLHMEGVRPVRKKSALLFGAALDSSLNELLLSKNLDKAQDVFAEKWAEVDPGNTDFSKSDLDEELMNYYGWKEKTPTWQSLFYKGKLFINQYYTEVLPKIKEVIAIQEPL